MDARRIHGFHTQSETAQAGTRSARKIEAKGWSLYLSNILDVATTSIHLGPLTLDLGAMLIVAAITVILAIGAKVSSRVSAIITAVKVSVVFLVIIVGAFYIKRENYTPFVPPAETSGVPGRDVHQSIFSLLTGATGSSYGWYGLLAAASLVFFAFIGFDVVATTAEETQDPQKAIPRGILGSLVIVTVLYVSVTLVLTGMVKYTDLRTGSALVGEGSATLATAFEAHGITWAQTAINVGGLAGLTTVVLVMMLGQTRVVFAMSRDGLLPRSFARTNNNGVPFGITVFVGTVVALTAGILPMGTLEEMVNIGTLFAFVVVCVGVVVLRRTRPELPRGFRVPFVPVLPGFAVLACGWLMLNLSVETWVRFAVWMLLGIGVYFCYGYRKSVLRAPTPQQEADSKDAAEASFVIVESRLSGEG